MNDDLFAIMLFGLGMLCLIFGGKVYDMDGMGPDPFKRSSEKDRANLKAQTRPFAVTMLILLGIGSIVYGIVTLIAR